jgi:hypothetical protein
MPEMTDKEQQKLAYRQNAVPGTLFYRIGWDKRISKVKVEKTTKTLLHLEDGNRLSIKRGLAMKEGYFISSTEYEPVLPFVTKQLEEEEKQREFITKYNDSYNQLTELLKYRYGNATDTQKRVDLLEIFDRVKDLLGEP